MAKDECRFQPWRVGPDLNRPDLIGLLEASHATRLEHLVPIRYRRISQSPFAFLRGSAAVMASDLAKTPVSGIQACSYREHIHQFARMNHLDVWYSHLDVQGLLAMARSMAGQNRSWCRTTEGGCEM